MNPESPLTPDPGPTERCSLLRHSGVSTVLPSVVVPLLPSTCGAGYAHLDRSASWLDPAAISPCTASPTLVTRYAMVRPLIPSLVSPGLIPMKSADWSGRVCHCWMLVLLVTTADLLTALQCIYATWHRVFRSWPIALTNHNRLFAAATVRSAPCGSPSDYSA